MKYEDKIRKLERLEREADILKDDIHGKIRNILMLFCEKPWHLDYTTIQMHNNGENIIAAAMGDEDICVATETFPIAWLELEREELVKEVAKRQELKKQEMQKKFEEMEAEKRQKKYEEYLALKKEFEK